jgi:hypothetical protein
VPAHLVDLYERSKSNLSKEQSKQLKNLLVEYQDVFSRNKNDLGRTGLTKHKIDVSGCEPIRQRPRVPPLEESNKQNLKKLQRQLKR